MKLKKNQENDKKKNSNLKNKIQIRYKNQIKSNVK
jgi:hypothetical protein